MFNVEQALKDLKDIEQNYKEALFCLNDELNQGKITKKALEQIIQKYLIAVFLDTY